MGAAPGGCTGAGEAEGRRMVCVIAVLMLQSPLKDVGALGVPASDAWVRRGCSRQRAALPAPLDPHPG